ncbi:MAG: hypothetical protein WBW48_13910 [Anaerolineae bacterium]
MLRAIAWIVWGCISWVDIHLFLPLRRVTGRLKLKKLFSAPVQWLKRRWTARTTKFADKARRWAFRMESPGIQEFRKVIGARADESQELATNSVISVYERLRFYLLTGKWEPLIRRFYYAMMFLAIILSICFSYFCLLFGDLIMSFHVDGFFLFLAMILLVISYVLFRSVLNQVSTFEKWILRILVWLPFLVWLTSLHAVLDKLGLPLKCFSILTILCLAGLMASVSTCAFLLQWRLLCWNHAIGQWLMMSSSSNLRQGSISVAAAWLLLLAPGGNDETGWRSPKEIDYLMEVSRVEREGAEWRGIVFTILALIGLANLSRVLPAAPGKTPAIFTFADPAVVIVGLAILLMFWGALLDIWLSEFPNQIIGLACVRAKHFLANHTGPIRVFENYRVVKVSDPESLTKGPHARWNLIAKHPLPDGGWRCLVEARVWIGLYDEHDKQSNRRMSATGAEGIAEVIEAEKNFNP